MQHLNQGWESGQRLVVTLATWQNCTDNEDIYQLLPDPYETKHVNSHELDLLLPSLDLALHRLPHGVAHPSAELQLLGALLGVLSEEDTCKKRRLKCIYLYVCHLS